MEGRGLPFEQCHSSTIDCNRWLTVSWGILIYSILPQKANGFPDNKVPLNALRSAIRTYRRLAISYVNGEGHQTQRVIWPIQLSFMDNARVVTGWCELRKAFRFFRTDRISSAEICDRYPARRADLIRDFHAQLSDEHGGGEVS
jgi:predicted DNA-binding transcriptional regulator YafY